MLSKRLSPVQSQGNFRETSHNVTTTNHQQCSLVTTPATGRVGIPWKKYLFEEHSGDSSGHRCSVEYIICCYCLWHVCTSLGCPPQVVSQFIFDCCGVAVAKKAVAKWSMLREVVSSEKPDILGMFGGWVFI